MTLKAAGRREPFAVPGENLVRESWARAGVFAIDEGEVEVD